MHRKTRLFARRPVAALLLSLCTGAWAAPLPVDLPAQPLSESILQLVRLSGQSIIVDSALIEGKQAAAVKGTMEPLEVLNRLLAGSGLAASAAADGALVVRRADTVLKEVAVVGNVPKEGSAEVGYKPESVSRVGPWGTRPIQETPYSISVLSADLIENVQALAVEEVFKYSPYAHVYMPAKPPDRQYLPAGFLQQPANL